MHLLCRILRHILYRVPVDETHDRSSRHKRRRKKGLNIVEFSDIYSWQNYIETSSYEQEIQEKNDLLRKQTRLLAVTEEQEKKRLAKDLHDGVGQSLSALKVILGMGKMQAKKSENPSLQKTAEKAADLADLSLKEMRNVLNNLKPGST